MTRLNSQLRSFATSSGLMLGTVVVGCGPGTVPVDAGAVDGGASDGPEPMGWEGLPFDAWSFERIPGAVCGNGSPYAVGVNPHRGAREIVFFVMGGGACWDAHTCFELESAAHIDEDYTRATFDRERAILSRVGWDDRNAALNPFREAHLVFAPYCTGDLHAGDAVQAYPGAPAGSRVHHRGAVATQGYVEAARAAWPSLERVRVIGVSAGGYGAQLNWGRYAEAWPSADVALLADSAPLMQPRPELYAAWRSSWNMQTPADCTSCASTFAAYADYFDARHPSSRLGLMATTGDRVLATFWGTSDLEPLLRALAEEHLDDNATTRVFIVESDRHVLLGEAFTLRGADGTLLIDWLAGWLVNDGRFHDVRPW